ncbi:hypothetical protein ACWD2L_06195 [Streptomyces sp. NPDC002754]
MSRERIQRKPSRAIIHEYETAADLERFDKAQTARQRAQKATREADQFLDWAVWDGRRRGR